MPWTSSPDAGMKTGHLFQTWNLTTYSDICRMVKLQVAYGALSPMHARTILGRLAIEHPFAEPLDRSAAALTAGMVAIVRADLVWIEGDKLPLEVAVWATVHALEDGWVKRKRDRGLQLTPLGRERMGMPA